MRSSPLPAYPLAVARRRPSGLYATQQTTPVCPRSVSTSRPDATSQIFTTPQLPDATRPPSGLYDTQRTPLACPRKVAISSPVAGSQIFTVVSELPDARRRPSGLY